jgi:hypothetical protein
MGVADFRIGDRFQVRGKLMDSFSWANRLKPWQIAGGEGQTGWASEARDDLLNQNQSAPGKNLPGRTADLPGALKLDLIAF